MWIVGERIGAGGFGQVFAATSADTMAVAEFVSRSRSGRHHARKLRALTVSCFL